LDTFLKLGEGDFLFFAGGKDILDFFGSGEPDSSESSSLSESEDDDSSFFFLAKSLGGDLGFGAPLAFATTRTLGDGSESEELSSSDSDFGAVFFRGFTGGGDTDTGECCLFFGDGEEDTDTFRPRKGGEAACLPGEVDESLRRGEGERCRLGGEYLGCGDRRLGEGFLLLRPGGENLRISGLRRLISGVLCLRTKGDGDLISTRSLLPLTGAREGLSSSLESPEDELDDSLPLSSSSCFL
jgi:hypothetical protein